MTRNIDMRLDARRAKVYYLWMTGTMTKKEIAEKLGVGETTIDNDLEAIRREVTFTEKVPSIEEINWEKVRKEALESLQMVKAMLLQSYDESEGKPWTQARILDIMKDIDVRILERVAQPPQTRVDIKMIKQDALTVVSFLTDKHKDLVPEFKNYIKQARIRGIEKNPELAVKETDNESKPED